MFVTKKNFSRNISFLKQKRKSKQFFLKRQGALYEIIENKKFWNFLFLNRHIQNHYKLNAHNNETKWQITLLKIIRTHFWSQHRQITFQNPLLNIKSKFLYKKTQANNLDSFFILLEVWLSFLLSWWKKLIY